MKLGDIIRSDISGIKADGSHRKLSLSVIRKPLDSKSISRIQLQTSIVVASHYKWFTGENALPKNCIKFFHSFNSNPDWVKIPVASLSESDMVDKSWCGGFKKGRVQDGVLMVTLDHDAGMSTKGFFMTAAVAAACKKDNIKLTIIDYGRGGGWSEDLQKVRDFLQRNGNEILRGKPDNNQKRLADVFRSHKVFVCSSIFDASPKTVSESLCRGTRVIMNNKCLGGLKYINSMTGRSMDMPANSRNMWDNFDNVVENVRKNISEEIQNNYDPSEVSSYYHSHWGLLNTSKLLANELRNNFPGYVAICYDELKKHLIKNIRV